MNINLWAVLAAAVASMIVGFLWYGPLFGKEWMKLVGFSQKDIEKAKEKGMTKTYFLSFLSSIVLAYFTGMLVVAMQATTLTSGAQTGFLIWLGFVATTQLSNYLYEGRSLKLYKINVGYFLIQLLVIGALMAVWV